MSLRRGRQRKPQPKRQVSVLEDRRSRLPSWQPDESTGNCTACQSQFTLFRRRHHCRSCGNIFCGACSSYKQTLAHFGINHPVRVCRECDQCVARPVRAPRALASNRYWRASSGMGETVHQCALLSGGEGSVRGIGAYAFATRFVTGKVPDADRPVCRSAIHFDSHVVDPRTGDAHLYVMWLLAAPPGAAQEQQAVPSAVSASSAPSGTAAATATATDKPEAVVAAEAAVGSSKTHLRTCKYLLFFFNLVDPASLAVPKWWLQLCKSLLGTDMAQKQLALVGTKHDLVKQQPPEASKALVEHRCAARRFALENHLAYYETAASEGLNVDDLFADLTRGPHRGIAAS
eukprot:m.126669 g.126669  ORF g.126669 m.126669 type:complete len:346 (-) comp16683_c0_seq2:43-1080(-)